MAEYQLGRAGRIYIGTALDRFANEAEIEDIVDETTYGSANTKMNAAIANFSTSVWNNVADVTITRSAQDIDYTTRSSAGFDAVANVSKTVEVTGTSNVMPGAMAQLALIEEAYEDQVSIGAMIISDTATTPGATGYIGNWNVTAATVAQPIKGVMTVQWTLRGSTIRYYTVKPAA